MPKKSVLEALNSSDLTTYIASKIKKVEKSDSFEFKLPPHINDAETTLDSYYKSTTQSDKLAVFKFNSKSKTLNPELNTQFKSLSEINKKEPVLSINDSFKNFIPHKQQKQFEPPIKVHKIQKEVKLRDFENFDRMTETELDSIGLQFLQKLYMIQPTNKSSILYRLQMSHNSNFDGSDYTETMLQVMQDCYQLPNHPTFKRFNIDDKEKIMTNQPYDELFIWSLLLYSGSKEDLRLPRFFWSKSKFPIACCLAAIIIYQNLKSESLIPDYLKEEMDLAIKEFESMAIEVLKKANEKNQLITQDLLICEIEIFFKHTILELSIKAHAYDFVCLAPVQQLFTDVWYDKIHSHISSWQIILPYLFFPCLLAKISYFHSDINVLENLTELNENDRSHVNLKKNSVSPVMVTQTLKEDSNSVNSENLNIPNAELSYRSTQYSIKGIYRIYAFHNAPIIKFINHFIAFSVFLILFSFFLLFDYYPDKEVASTIIKCPIPGQNSFIYMTITELILIICVCIYHMGEIEQFLKKRTFDQKFFTKLKCFYKEDKWNIFDIFLFLIFYAGLCIRLLPMYGGHVFNLGGENCYELARVLYCINLILWYIRILQKVSCLTFWGPKIIIIQAMINKLVYYVLLILIFLIPFSTTVESILHKTQPFSFWVLVNSINRTFWSMFGELLGILSEFDDFECNEKVNRTDKDLLSGVHHSCGDKSSSLFLYGSFAFYTVTVNLLLLNMIIATFASTVEEIEKDSTKLHRFQRFEGIKEFADKSMIPAPFVIFEYIINLALYFRNIINGTEAQKKSSFRIENLEEFQKEYYMEFETESRSQFWTEKCCREEEGESAADKSEMLLNAVSKLEKSFTEYKIWTLEQLNERFLNINKSIHQIAKRLDK